MMRAHTGVGVSRARIALGGLLCLAASLHAQSASPPLVAASLRLVRCGALRDAACLTTRLVVLPGVSFGGGVGATAARWSATLAEGTLIGPDQPRVSGEMPPDIAPVFGVPVLRATSMGRTALRGYVVLASGKDTLVRQRTNWRPPMMSLPAFAGIADSALLPEPLRNALDASAEPPAVRPLLALVLVLTGILLVVYIPRFLWSEHHESEEDMARQVAASRALLSTQELALLRGSAPREGKPRTPEESTRGVPMPRPSDE